MKTKEQILRYISQCEFDDDDWQRVLDYCRQKFGGGKAHRSIRPLPNSKSSYACFLDWIDNGIGVGDIVRYGHIIGIIGAYTPGYARLAAYLTLDGNLICDAMEIAKDKIYQADEDDINTMKRKLTDNACEFSVSLSSCVKSYQPKDGEAVRITNGDELTTAIFHTFDAKYACFYVYIDGGDVIQNKKCAVSDIKMSLPTKRDMQRLSAALSKNRLEWHTGRKILRDVVMLRSEKNGRYWYLSDRFSVCSDVDKYTKLHEERWRCGNYFVSYQSAILFCQKVQEVRKWIAEG